MIGQATVTAKTGPGLSVTTKVIPNCIGYRFDFLKQMLYIDVQGGLTQEYAIDTLSTLTSSISLPNVNITVVE